MKVLLVSPDPASRETTALAVAGLERRTGERIEFVWTTDGEKGIDAVWRREPDVVIADEIASRAGAFALAKDVRGDRDPYGGVIVILLERKQDIWLAKWSGADAWFVKPVDPFELADRILELAQARETA
jgi:DNA-binding response OmpR family regulator